mmetsp:Transcript_51571/g.116236  ORF Transcript_51571/g.116236 Transcript_51571/m.116236 type:complete len:502 (-) Transcript_51571:61-1566(-)
METAAKLPVVPSEDGDDEDEEEADMEENDGIEYFPKRVGGPRVINCFPSPGYVSAEDIEEVRRREMEATAKIGQPRRWNAAVLPLPRLDPTRAGKHSPKNSPQSNAGGGQSPPKVRPFPQTFRDGLEYAKPFYWQFPDELDLADMPMRMAGKSTWNGFWSSVQGADLRGNSRSTFARTRLTRSVETRTSHSAAMDMSMPSSPAENEEMSHRPRMTLVELTEMQGLHREIPRLNLDEMFGYVKEERVMHRQSSGNKAQSKEAPRGSVRAPPVARPQGPAQKWKPPGLNASSPALPTQSVEEGHVQKNKRHAYERKPAVPGHRVPGPSEKITIAATTDAKAGTPLRPRLQEVGQGAWASTSNFLVVRDLLDTYAADPLRSTTQRRATDRCKPRQTDGPWTFKQAGGFSQASTTVGGSPQSSTYFGSTNTATLRHGDLTLPRLDSATCFSEGGWRAGQPGSVRPPSIGARRPDSTGSFLESYVERQAEIERLLRDKQAGGIPIH